jgi:hypothetical protein
MDIVPTINDDGLITSALGLRLQLVQALFRQSQQQSEASGSPPAGGVDRPPRPVSESAYVRTLVLPPTARV